MDRREFLGAAATLALAGRLEARQEVPDWGGRVIDCHMHLRATPEAHVAHMDGSGVTHAVLRARDNPDAAKAVLDAYPGRFAWTASVDARRPDAADVLTRAVKAGALGFGEIKSHVDADGPELRRLYALAADLGVTIMVHFQEVPHFEGEGTWASGFKRFEAVLKAFPNTRFIGHADAFWANVSAGYADDVAYPSGPIVRGGITDRLLSDYPNLYGDLSANSGNNALSRDEAFTRDFLVRHQDKLIFGSDCSCRDGRGGGVSQANNPAANRLAGKCVARETLALLRRSATPEIFRKLVAGNAERLLWKPA